MEKKYWKSQGIFQSGKVGTMFLRRIVFPVKLGTGSEFDLVLFMLLQAEEMVQHHLVYVSPKSSVLIPPYICLQCIHGLR